jgi:hypothetical protein
LPRFNPKLSAYGLRPIAHNKQHKQQFVFIVLTLGVLGPVTRTPRCHVPLANFEQMFLESLFRTAPPPRPLLLHVTRVPPFPPRIYCKMYENPSSKRRAKNCSGCVKEKKNPGKCTGDLCLRCTVSILLYLHVITLSQIETRNWGSSLCALRSNICNYTVAPNTNSTWNRG